MQQGEAAKSKAARLEGEAVELFYELREKYSRSEYGYGFTIGDIAKSSLFEIKNLGVGKTAPDIRAEDLDGETFKLSDYRGKTVLLSFWASWCGPCMALVPRERELVERYKGRPFALVGVNADMDKEQLRSALEAHPVTWRSFSCGEKGPFGPIPRSWNVNSWPTVSLIDHAGVIRAKHLDFKALPAMIEELVAEAERAAKTD
jgi:thiol-disulfide isomerase/thioredoxin